ncbi:MAG: TIGR01458 family HAD-type hydrolase [Hyphomicrobiaceae bacterium]
MPNIKGLLIDLDGVVYQAGAALPGSIEALDRLRNAQIPFRFLTNTTSKPISHIVRQMKTFGIPVDGDEIFTPAVATCAYIREHDLAAQFLTRPVLMEDFSGLPEGTKPAVVIGDAGDDFNYANLNSIFRQLKDGAELIALASNRMFVDEDGELSLDVGAFVAALEYASGCKAVVLGKPSPAFFDMAVGALQLEPGEVAMIGDDAEFDASAAVAAGLTGYLVKTGKWSEGATDGLDPQPTGIFDDLAAFTDWLLGPP